MATTSESANKSMASKHSKLKTSVLKDKGPIRYPDVAVIVAACASVDTCSHCCLCLYLTKPVDEDFGVVSDCTDAYLISNHAFENCIQSCRLQLEPLQDIMAPGRMI